MKKTVVALCALIGACCASCSLLFPSVCSLLFPSVYHIRYRLTVEIKADNVVYTGSGVVESSYKILSDDLAFADSGAFGGDLHGYAVTVDLKQHGLVYFLNSRPVLANESGADLYPDGENLVFLPFAAFYVRPRGPPSLMESILKKFSAMRVRSADIPYYKLPMMVRFVAPGDVRSVQELDPHDLNSTLGPGVAFVRATLNLTDDPISPVPDIWPRWLSELSFKNIGLNGRLYKMQSLSYQNFEGIIK